MFVHVPKCAGTDLMAHLKIRYPWLHESMKHSIPVEELVRNLSGFASKVKSEKDILVGGHIELQWFIREKLIRFEDKMFTIIRDPYKRVISLVNYVVSRFMVDPTCAAADTASWAKMLGITTVSEDMTFEEQCRLADKVLFSDDITKKCHVSLLRKWQF
ncbi:MAG: sulfotransferase family 2 domain-containing protein [Defluviicoccus sp.]|nr:MAG: sulfotransferase family 2 domain-containing protein [Defluviicoccus sp.]